MKKVINPVLLEEEKKFKKEYRQLLNAIKRYDHICVFRHIVPDYDALGSQMGLVTWLKDNFPNKTIKYVGDNHVTFTPRLFPEMETLSEDWFKEPFLAIVVDVNGNKRIADPRFKKAKFKIIIDHHPLDADSKAKVIIDDTSMAAAGELIADILISYKKKGYVISEECAKYLYTAIVGDSGRFQYSSTTAHTFAVCEELLGSNINISKIYQNMYLKTIPDLAVTAHILNHYSISKHGVAYYVLDLDTVNALNITTERGKENVNLFSNIEGINAWCSITEDSKEPCFRISIRSKEKDISEVARKWGGGGHAQASGARIDSLKDLDAFIKDLDDLFI